MSTDPRLLELLDAELDGLLDSAGATELAGRLAADEEARAARAELQRMHAALARLPEEPVPAALRASILARLSQRPLAANEPDTNLSGPAGYVIAWPRRAFRARQTQITHSHTPRSTMKRSKILASGAIAAAVGAVLYFGVMHSKVGPGDTFGTIAPAQRYQAATVGANDVQLGDERVVKFMQTDAFRLIQGDA